MTRTDTVCHKAEPTNIIASSKFEVAHCCTRLDTASHCTLLYSCFACLSSCHHNNLSPFNFPYLLCVLAAGLQLVPSCPPPQTAGTGSGAGRTGPGSRPHILNHRSYHILKVSGYILYMFIIFNSNTMQMHFSLLSVKMKKMKNLAGQF